uniref:tRNA wybutosine-synthesizing protein 3 homolog n=1 Tax=Octopus bimaculoides TaxID=37653 RepID=A0A0L8GLY1_OCTBM
MAKSFALQKKNNLSKIDCSRKGSIDAPILSLCQYINSLEQYFTTSSCSGRIIIFEDVAPLEEITGDAVFKFEPFVMHIQCRELHDAQTIHAVSVASGFRNSGITVNRKGKIIAAIRSTQCLEVPLSNNGELLVSKEYIDYIIGIANQKMSENLTRIQRLFENLQEANLKNSGSHI